MNLNQKQNTLEFGIMLPYIKTHGPERKIMFHSNAGLGLPIYNFKNKIYNHMKCYILK
jgi:hypothetical protein